MKKVQNRRMFSSLNESNNLKDILIKMSEENPNNRINLE